MESKESNEFELDTQRNILSCSSKAGSDNIKSKSPIVKPAGQRTKGETVGFSRYRGFKEL